jgi:hypothetical protein
VRVELDHPDTVPAGAAYDAAVADLETGTVLRLPDGASGPFHVFVNGTEQREGDDYTAIAEGLRFTTPLRVARREGLWKKLVMSTAGIGFYGRGDQVDVHYTAADGTPMSGTGLQVSPGT